MRGWAITCLIGAAALAGSVVTHWRLADGRAAAVSIPAATCDSGASDKPSTLAASEAPGVPPESSERQTAAAHLLPDAAGEMALTEVPDETSAERLTSMNDHFMQSALDGPRSTALARAIASGEPAVPEGTTVDDVRCRGSSCRIRARYNTPEAEQAFIEALGQRAETRDKRQTVLHPDDDEGPSTVIYLTEPDADGG